MCSITTFWTVLPMCSHFLNTSSGQRKGKIKMKIRYYVSGIGYDNDECVTDDSWDFGDFDTYEEAYELFVKLQCRNASSFFTEKENNVYEMLIQLEECEETDELIECVDVKNEWWVQNPNFKEETK